MGKEKPGFLTAKAFSNRIKSKGLQKLRWFCQLCQKQCRDENGFKCHMTSESHHRQMLLFDENKDSVMSEYTRQFMRGYLDILKRAFGGKRTLANVIYQEYIKDKSHVHMNSTKFTTLTGFINCMQKMGLCAVDQTEKGWFIEYIAKDPEAEYKENKKRRMQQTEIEEDDHFFDMIAKRKKESFDEEEKIVYTELVKADDEKISISFKRPQKVEENPLASCSLWKEGKEEKKERKEKEREKSEKQEKIDKKECKLSILEEIRIEQERMKERANRKPYWLQEGIVVRLVDDRLPPELQKAEVAVRKLEDRYSAIVRTVGLAGGDRRMKVRQEHVVTVVPPAGGAILVVNGGYRGARATVVKADRGTLTADIVLTSSVHSGARLSAVAFDDICKLAD